MTSTHRVIKIVEALYDNIPQADDELEFRRGDRIVILDQVEDEWWSGYIENQPEIKGVLPENYVRIVHPDEDISPQDSIRERDEVENDYSNRNYYSNGEEYFNFEAENVKNEHRENDFHHLREDENIFDVANDSGYENDNDSLCDSSRPLNQQTKTRTRTKTKTKTKTAQSLENDNLENKSMIDKAEDMIKNKDIQIDENKNKEEAKKRSAQLKKSSSLGELKKALALAEQNRLEAEKERKQAEEEVIKAKLNRRKSISEYEKNKENNEIKLMEAEDYDSMEIEVAILASITIQSCIRMALAKQRVKCIRKQKAIKEAAAIKIQSAGRRKLAYTHVKKIRIEKSRTSIQEYQSTSHDQLDENTKALIASMVRERVEKEMIQHDELMVEMQKSLNGLYHQLLQQKQQLHSMHVDNYNLQILNGDEKDRIQKSFGSKSITKLPPLVISPHRNANMKQFIISPEKKKCSKSNPNDSKTELPLISKNDNRPSINKEKIINSKNRDQFHPTPKHHWKENLLEIQNTMDCKTAIYPPQDYNPNETSSSPPSSHLLLQHVYGYNGSIHRRKGIPCTRNIYSLTEEEIIYPASNVVVLHNIKLNTQRFYFGHDGLVQALCVDNNEKIVASGQYGLHSTIDVWEAFKEDEKGKKCSLMTPRCLARLQHHKNGVMAMNFSSDGELLVSLGGDDAHTIVVCYWKEDRVLASMKGHLSCVFDINFHPCPTYNHETKTTSYELVSCGIKHIKFWSISSHQVAHKDKQIQWHLEGKEGTSIGKAITYHSICFLPLLTQDEQSPRDIDGFWLSGAENGDVYIWKQIVEIDQNCLSRIQSNGVLVSVISAAHRCTISSISFQSHRNDIATCSIDGVIKFWNADDLINLKETEHDLQTPRVVDISLDSMNTKNSPRCITWNGDELIVGFIYNTISRIQFKSKDEKITHSIQPLITSHPTNIQQIESHPNKPWFASLGNNKMIYLYDTTTHNLIGRSCLPDVGLAMCFHPNGKLLCVGTQWGMILVYQIDYKLDGLSHQWIEKSRKTIDIPSIRNKSKSEFQKRFSNIVNHESTTSPKRPGTISCMKYSPDGEKLAVAWNSTIVIFDTTGEGCKKLHSFRGHSSNVNNLDWNIDGTLIQSTDVIHELLYWDINTWKQVLDLKLIADVTWKTWTCTLGWPVQGIWKKFETSESRNSRSKSNKVVINSVNRSLSCDEMIVTNDSNVHLYRYPCLNNTARSYVAHSSSIKSAKYLWNDMGVITIEVKEPVIFEWKRMFEDGYDYTHKSFKSPDYVVEEAKAIDIQSNDILHANDKEEIMDTFPFDSDLRNHHHLSIKYNLSPSKPYVLKKKSKSSTGLYERSPRIDKGKLVNQSNPSIQD